MKLYLYAIIDSGDPIDGRVCGLRGSDIFNVAYRDIGAAVSEIDPFVPEATEGDVMDHEAAVEKLMADFTVLPVRFQTIFDRREDLLSMMQGRYADFKDNLERVRSKVEFGVKVIWPAEKIRRSILDTLERDKPNESPPHDSAGRRFLERKLEEYKLDKEFEARADKFIKIMDTFLSRFAAEKKLRKLKTEDLLLDAAYLVEKSQQRDFRETFWRVQNAHPGFKYLFSGPWPAYNFVALSERPGLDGDSEQGGLFDGAAKSRTLTRVGSL